LRSREAGVRGSGSAFTDDDGRYRIEGLAPGRYVVRAGVSNEADHLAAQDHEVLVEAGKTATADVALRDGARVLVEVISPDGDPLAEATVDIEAASASGIRERTNSRGIARFAGVPLGDCVAIATAAGSPRATSEPVHVEAGRDARVRIQLSAGVSLRVRATSPGGEAALVSRITARDASGRVVGSWSDDEDGGSPEVFVPRGRIAVEASSGGTAGKAEVEVGDSPTEIVIRVGEPSKSGGR
ncbi:MAG TPA: carboxypeptidase-like regulatory domain-containing protein, partial [Planctomycetota bacterium]|nr:carboxypeptidase-like regulatory domain-containing protein [Planctomycetota bacterium]